MQTNRKDFVTIIMNYYKKKITKYCRHLMVYERTKLFKQTQRRNFHNRHRFANTLHRNHIATETTKIQNYKIWFTPKRSKVLK